MTANGEKILQAHNFECTHSKLKTDSFMHMWKIDNFSLRQVKPGEKLKSSTFSSRSNNEVKWYLTLYPNGQTDEYKEYLSIFLYLASCGTLKVTTVTGAFLTLNANTERTNAIPFTHTPEKLFSNWGFPQFVKRSLLMEKSSELLPNDTLTLFCQGTVVFQDDVTTSENRTDVIFRSWEEPKCTALLDFGMLLASEKFSDITISSDNKEIRAHKAILTARSPVFSVMLDSNMEETKQHRIEINDMKPEEIQEMLQFIYTGKAPNLGGMAGGLLAAADKYDLKGLKFMCATALFEALTTQNAAETLILADRHGEITLKDHTIDFIKENLKGVIETPNYALMAESNPHLIDEILRAKVAMESSNSQKYGGTKKQRCP